MPSRIGFATSVQLGLSAMDEIATLGGRLELVMTLPDDIARKKSGRVSLDEFCQQHRFPLMKVRNINDPDSVAAISAAGLDWLFVLESQIVGPEVLAAPRLGCLGMHPALLPQGRGRAVIPWAILKGLSRTGLTMFKLDAGVDTGPILAQHEIPVAPDETATTLYAKVMEAHRTLIRLMWDDLVNGVVTLREQAETDATVWPGRKPEDGRIESNMALGYVERLVRAVTRPYPGARWRRSDGEDLIIWAGHIGNDNDDASADRKVVLRDGFYVIDDWEVSS